MLLDRAEELGRRALELDASLAPGHITLAFVNINRGRSEQAIVEAERAIELDPNNADAHAARGLGLAIEGRFLEATRAIKRAWRLNPRGYTDLVLITAGVNYGAGRREEAIGLVEQVRVANRDHIIAGLGLAAVYEQEGRHAEAQVAVREVLRVTPDLTVERAIQLLAGLETIIGPEEFARLPGNLRKAGLP